MSRCTRIVYHENVNFSSSYENFTTHRQDILCFCSFSLVIRSCFAVVPLRLTIRIVAVTLTAGMPDKVFSASHTRQDRALRKHIVISTSAGGATSATIRAKAYYAISNTECISAAISALCVFGFCFTRIFMRTRQRGYLQKSVSWSWRMQWRKSRKATRTVCRK